MYIFTAEFYIFPLYGVQIVPPRSTREIIMFLNSHGDPDENIPPFHRRSLYSLNLLSDSKRRLILSLLETTESLSLVETHAKSP